jgi:hypothetical protein
MSVRFCQRCSACVPAGTNYAAVEVRTQTPHGCSQLDYRLLCSGCGIELARFLAPRPALPPAPARPRHHEPRLRGGRDECGPGLRDLVRCGPPISVRRRWPREERP